jgi:hypothetical protein
MVVLYFNTGTLKMEIFNMKQYCVLNNLPYKSIMRAIKRDGKYKNMKIVEFPETLN